MSKVRETVLEIDLKVLQKNFEYLKSKIHPDIKTLAVVKAFAYGSDAVEIAKYLEELEVDYFAVAYAQEGVALRDAGIKTPILVLHPQLSNFKLLIERCLEPSIYSARILTSFLAIAEEQNQKNYPIHIKFNTGLNRLGFSQHDVDYVMAQLSDTEAIRVKSIFSHLAASEDINESAFTQNQISSFKKASSLLIQKLGYQPMRHMTNTSGILNYPEAHFNMVRTGIGLYGFGNAISENKHLEPIATFKSIISQIHNIEKGESVGYNRAYKASAFEKTATIPVGHADGISRIYGHRKGYVFIHGKKAFIVGNVCMDMLMVDITHIDCKEGDEVIVFGPKNTAETLSENAGTISYELLTSVSQRIKRVFRR